MKDQVTQLIIPNKIYEGLELSSEELEIWNKFWNNVLVNKNYNSLAKSESEIIKEIYKKHLTLKYPNLTSGKNCQGVVIGENVLLLSQYDRIVIGDHGAYIEFDESHLRYDLELTESKKYRNSLSGIKYYWMNPIGFNNIKIYKQTKTVGYASYKAGKYYISPYECTILYKNISDEYTKDELF